MKVTSIVIKHHILKHRILELRNVGHICLIGLVFSGMACSVFVMDFPGSSRFEKTTSNMSGLCSRPPRSLRGRWGPGSYLAVLVVARCRCRVGAAC